MDNACFEEKQILRMELNLTQADLNKTEDGQCFLVFLQ